MLCVHPNKLQSFQKLIATNEIDDIARKAALFEVRKIATYVIMYLQYAM